LSIVLHIFFLSYTHTHTFPVLTSALITILRGILQQTLNRGKPHDVNGESLTSNEFTADTSVEFFNLTSHTNS